MLLCTLLVDGGRYRAIYLSLFATSGIGVSDFVNRTVRFSGFRRGFETPWFRSMDLVQRHDHGPWPWRDMVSHEECTSTVVWATAYAAIALQSIHLFWGYCIVFPYHQIAVYFVAIGHTLLAFGIIPVSTCPLDIKYLYHRRRYVCYHPFRGSRHYPHCCQQGQQDHLD